MKKVFLSLLILSLTCFAGQLIINYNSGTPTTIDFSDISSMEIVSATIPENMALVDGGTFQMGSSDISYATPVHSVTLSSFYIGKYEVTQAEWITTMGSNPSYFTGDLQRPVETIRWYDILVYCNKRSLAEGLTPAYSISGSTNPNDWGTVPTTIDTIWNAVNCNWSSNGYRLPSEAEWEFAARGGNNSHSYTYSGSNVLDDVAWYRNNSTTTQTVGLKTPNELGLFDMSGNVYEWNWDWIGEYSPEAQTNPHGLSTGIQRVMRGGSYYFLASRCRVAYRDYYSPNSQYDDLGFRLCRSL